MKTETDGKRVTIYINSNDQHHGKPLYAAIIQLCEVKGIAGATVFRAAEGYGAHHELHTVRFLSLTENMPVCIEVIDLPERIEPFLAELDGLITGGLVTVSDVHVIRYRQEG
jgi:PII-like signaling protein